MKVNLVFEGGGVLGITFVGAYKALSEKKIQVDKIAGTSAGSIIAALLASGYTADELIEVLKNTEYKQFMRKTKLSKIFLLGKPLSLICNKGIYDSKVIEDWMDELLQKKGVSTFGDIMKDNDNKLKIIAADITKSKMLILPDDLKSYNIDPLEFSVAKAVRMSCTIPYFFTPVKLNYNKKSNFIVDGGIISSFPIWIFDINGKPNKETIGFKIKDEKSLTSTGRKDIIAFTSDIINAAINKKELIYVRDKDFVSIVTLDYNGCPKATDFDLTNEQIEELYNIGYNSTKEFLNNSRYFKYL